MSTLPPRALALGLVVAAAVTLLPSDASAVRFRRPFSAAIGVNYGRDNDGGGGGCDDYQCGSVCYDGHSGTDFPLSVGTQVLAVANGVVTATYNGCANYGYYGNTCGGRCGNYVRVDHDDGMRSLYCHMQLDSIAVSTGQHVSCGDVLGRSASSGSSTGPHLHLGTYVNGNTVDPFSGSCTQGTSYWVAQGSYPHPIPSAECENVCDCTPGATQDGSCGNCGTHHRTCGADCHWNAWSECQGQGECPAGSVDSRACCDCGTETRQCSGQCEWGDWGACAGPDPNGGTEPCPTGEPGPCADGRVRCVAGCVACASVWEPVPERCDGEDEDCTGVADDGFPTELGEPPPLLAATLLDASYPQLLAPGSVGVAWATFRNDGQLAWTKESIWLVPTASFADRACALRDEPSWPAFDVAALLAARVEPGELATLTWSVRMPAEPSGTIEEGFQLMASDGTLLRCPSPIVELAIRLDRGGSAGAAAGGAGGAGAAPAEDADAPAGCGCRLAHRQASGSAGALLALLGVALRARRRRRGRDQPVLPPVALRHFGADSTRDRGCPRSQRRPFVNESSCACIWLRTRS